ncbi:MAG: hypothetical protein WC824_07735 [Bacteroidota bacterium]|jgi:hypothetical protein
MKIICERVPNPVMIVCLFDAPLSPVNLEAIRKIPGVQRVQGYDRLGKSFGVYEADIEVSRAVTLGEIEEWLKFLFSPISSKNRPKKPGKRPNVFALEYFPNPSLVNVDVREDAPDMVKALAKLPGVEGVETFEKIGYRRKYRLSYERHCFDGRCAPEGLILCKQVAEVLGIPLAGDFGNLLSRSPTEGD